MMHGSGAPVPAGGTTSANGVSAIPKHHRSSNSFSSASIVTVKRAGSLSSSSTGARNSNAPMRAPSPGETSLIALRVGREQLAHEHKRRKSVAVDSTDRPNSDALGNLNRHSHSSNSGGASAGSTRRSRASSGAILPNLMSQANSPQKRSTRAVDYSPRASPVKQQVSRPGSRIQQSPTASPDRGRRPSRPELANPLNNLSSLYPAPALTDPNDTESPSTIRSIATASTQTSYGPDYFGEDSTSPQSKAKEQKPVMIRNHTAPMDVSRLQPTDAARENEMPNRRSDPRDDRAVEIENGGRPIEMAGEETIVSPVKSNGKRKKSRTRDKGDKEKKVMLSKALQKANTAVLLDNAQNFEGALDAYIDACDLLQQVMDRSSGPDDQRKLDAIKLTYTNRIDELQQLELAQPESSDEKELPPRPMSDSSSMPVSPALVSPTIDSTIKDTPAIETAVTGDDPNISSTQMSGDGDGFFFGTLSSGAGFSQDEFELPDPSASAPYDNILDRDTFSLESPVSSPRRLPNLGSNLGGDAFSQRAVEVSPLRTNMTRLPPAEDRDVPAPLSPTRSRSPTRQHEPDYSWMDTTDLAGQQNPSLSRKNSNPWLDTIDERGSSRASSVHSVSSQQELRRKHLRGVSGVSNPDFDAAFDAAMETAYNEGLEPDLDAKAREKTIGTHVPSGSTIASDLDTEEVPSSVKLERIRVDNRLDADEEEERLLDDFAQDYAQTFNFDMSSKSALPRQSDSSGYSRSTWQSSQVSDRTTAGTSLSTVAEDGIPLPLSKNAFATSPPINNFLVERPPPPLPPSAPPPQISLPKLPTTNQNKAPGVRSRRLSGQNLKQLKIETTAKSDARKRASTFHQSSSPYKDAPEEQPEFDKDFKFGAPLEPLTASDTQQEHSLKSPPSLDIRSAVSDSSQPVTATTEQRESFDDDPGELHMHRPSVITKSKSSVSLREHTVLLASPTIDNGPTLATPMSSTFMNFAPSTKRNNETPLTSQRANLPSFGGHNSDSLYSGGGFLFDTSLSAPQLPSSPKSPAYPAGVEPCPESFLLRPFWLMRNIAATLTHPKGAFLTSRLFVPREVWQTRGVKIKSIEDKISNCDLLTAALGRLAAVDTFDADAVMEELQGFEDVMERVQNTFVKRLGNDVGISGLPGIFKDATGGPASATTFQASDTTAGAEKTKSKESKGGYLSSWRKLRSKSSGTTTTAAQAAKSATKFPEGESLNMTSVPMTSWVPVQSRGHKRDVKNFTFDGPNKEYMSSLARLCEGVQVLDQIARQVEDPGLKGTSPTHVGLELSIRHASEFFGFYVCRFVLTDLGILIDKFVKRGTEWVMT